MRPEKLVGGTDQEVAIPLFNRQGSVRSVMHGIEKHLRPGLVCQGRYFFHRMDGPAEIRGTGNRHQAGPSGEFRGQVIQVQGSVPWHNINNLHQRPGIGGGPYPGSEICIMG